MIVTAHYRQNVRIRPKGKRNFEDISAISTMPVNVREVASDRAPIVCWWCGKAAYRTGRIATRVFDGQLYEPVVVVSQEVPSVQANQDFWSGSDGLRVADASSIEFFASRPWMVGSNGVLAHQNNIATPTVDDLRAALNLVEFVDTERYEARTVDEFEKLLLVDGVLHSRAKLPTFTTSLVDGRILPLSDDYSDMSARPGHRFPVTQFDRALALHQSNLDAKEDASWMRPDVLRSDVLDADLTSENIARTTAVLLRAVQVSHLGHRALDDNLARMPRDTILAYGRLRDAVAADRPPFETLPLMRIFHMAFEGQDSYGAINEVACAMLDRAVEDGVDFMDPYASDLEVLGASL